MLFLKLNHHILNKENNTIFTSPLKVWLFADFVPTHYSVEVDLKFVVFSISVLTLPGSNGKIPIPKNVFSQNLQK